MKYYILGFQNYFNMSGKSTKEEFWYFILIQILLSILVSLLSVNYITIAFCLLTIIPTLSIQCRRLNDVGKNKFWALSPLGLVIIDIILYFFLIENHSIIKNILFVILGLLKGIVIILLIVWYLKDSKRDTQMG